MNKFKNDWNNFNRKYHGSWLLLMEALRIVTVTIWHLLRTALKTIKRHQP